MKDNFYGDKKDIMKWGSLDILAKRYNVHTVAYIVMYRSENIEKYRLESSEGFDSPLSKKVAEHFWNIDNIKGLETKTSLNIKVFKNNFEWTPNFYSKMDFRKKYFEQVIAFVKSFGQTPTLVFVDPDTGIKKESGDFEYITCAEIEKLYFTLKKGDMLCIYQHAQHDKNWISKNKDILAQKLCTNIEHLKLNKEHEAVLLYTIKELPHEKTGVKFSS